MAKRGRPTAEEREQRKRAILDAALDVLVEQGYEQVTMLGVAERAGASKETLYSWFGSREGLFAALIERTADSSAEAIGEALDRGGDPTHTLTRYCDGLLTLLTGESSVAINRAAMGHDGLARTLLVSGRLRIGPLVEKYLAGLQTSGEVGPGDPATMFELLYGLVVRDTQIRVLLGEKPPTAAQRSARATEAVEQFFSLVGPGG